LNTTYVWTREDGEEVEVEVEFTCSAYHPATYFDPPEGGEVEIERATVDPDCYPSSYQAEFDAEYNRPGSALLEKIEEHCFEYSEAVRHDSRDYW
jgi:hypothetical protein